MQKFYVFILTCFLCISSIQADNDYHYRIDLKNVVDDKLTVELAPPDINDNEILFYFPAMVPGTYEIYDFGRFVSNLKAKGKNGTVIKVQKMDANTYMLSPANQIELITYEVEDSFDTKIKEKVVFEPAGTNIETGKNFVINTHGFFGYFKNMINRNFILEFEKPAGFYPSTGLNDLKISDSKDIISASDYHKLVDSPILYCEPDTTTITIANTKVLVSCYSPNKKISSRFAANNLKELLYAQRDYLGGELPVNKYAFLFYFTDKQTLSGSNGALEHSYSSFYVMPEMDSLYIAQSLRDVCAHEFFHIVTPLTIHSEEIGNFDFNEPKMSEHLWLYEGLTEYASHHAQAKAGLIDYDDFLSGMMDKYSNSVANYNDTVPFTFMSKHVLTKHYHKQYNNVYEKGAVISMCLDILLRYYSNGNYGTQELMKDLSKIYGKDKSFKDKELFNDIERLTYPEVRKFLDTHVAGNKPLPMEDIFKLIGLEFKKKHVKESYTLGGVGIGLNETTKRLVITDVSNVDEVGKKFKYKVGDELYSFNNRLLTLETAKDVIGEFMDNVKEGDKLVVEVYRKGKKDDYTVKKLSGKMKKVKVTQTNYIDALKNPTEQQITARLKWLGIDKEKIMEERD